MKAHNDYYMGDKFYYRIGLLDGLPIRFFIYDLAADRNEQLEFIHQHKINSISFTGHSQSSFTDTALEDTYKDFLTVIGQLPADIIALNLTYFQKYDNLEFLKRFSDCRQLELHCTLTNSFDFRILEQLSHVTLWYGKNLESMLQCPKLRFLCIFKPDSKALSHIGSLASLQTLSIRQTHIKSIEFLAQLHSLKSLQLRYLPKITSIAPLANLKSLKDLFFQNCIHIKDWNILGELQSLESLVIESCGHVEILEALEDRLQHLHLVGNSRQQKGR